MGLKRMVCKRFTMLSNGDEINKAKRDFGLLVRAAKPSQTRLELELKI